MNDVFSFQPRNARSLIALAIKARTRRRVGRKDTFRNRRYLFYRVLSDVRLITVGQASVRSRWSPHEYVPFCPCIYFTRPSYEGRQCLSISYLRYPTHCSLTLIHRYTNTTQNSPLKITIHPLKLRTFCSFSNTWCAKAYKNSAWPGGALSADHPQTTHYQHYNFFGMALAWIIDVRNHQTVF